MGDITTLGIDLAKNVFQVHAADRFGKTVWSKKVSRAKLKELIVNLPPCLVGMEACGSAHFFGREFNAMGHEVRLMAPQYVKPYVKGNKNDVKDAEAIAEAVTRPNMRFVPIKTIAQQNGSALHRSRSQVVARRVQVSNHLRGLLAEQGVICKIGHSSLRSCLSGIEGGEYKQFETVPFWLRDMMVEIRGLDQRIADYDREIKRSAAISETAQRLMQIPGVGPVTATAIEAKVGDMSCFKTGRDFAAFLGLVPRQNSSGGKERLLGISKRGDKYLRTLLVHGARAEINAVIERNKGEGLLYHCWIQSTVSRVGKNKAAVALANKNARIIWAMLKHKRDFNGNFAEIFCKAA